MLKLILKRLGLMIPLLILISIVVFSLAIIQPGDPFSDLQNGKIKQEAINAQREKLGLNDSIPHQYIRWVNHVIHGDLGESIKYKRPVIDVIEERIPNTILLGAMSLIITYIISFALGITSGRYSYSLTDYTVQIFNYLMLAIPSFIAGVFAIFFFLLNYNGFRFKVLLILTLKKVLLNII